MTTIINTPPTQTEDPASAIVVGIVFGAFIVILLLIFGVRYYAHSGPSANGSYTTPMQAMVTVPGGVTTVNVVTPRETTSTSTN
ncbi:MAG: hypothetical protein WCQ60_01225 [bacterium]